MFLSVQTSFGEAASVESLFRSELLDGDGEVNGGRDVDNIVNLNGTVKRHGGEGDLCEANSNFKISFSDSLEEYRKDAGKGEDTLIGSDLHSKLCDQKENTWSIWGHIRKG